MRSLASFASMLSQLFAVGGDVQLICVPVVIDGSGDATLGDDLNNTVSVARATNTYTLTFKYSWAKTKGLNVFNPVAATINCVPTATPASGTIACAFSGSVTSMTFYVWALVSSSIRG